MGTVKAYKVVRNFNDWETPDEIMKVFFLSETAEEYVRILNDDDKYFHDTFLIFPIDIIENKVENSVLYFDSEDALNVSFESPTELKANINKVNRELLVKAIKSKLNKDELEVFNELISSN